MEEFDKKKAIHYSFLALLVIGTAAVSAFTLHTILIRILWTKNNNQSRHTTTQKENRQVESTLHKDSNGVYVLPTTNPTFPLQPGNGSVGGVTACARLHNLRTCLQDKKSSLASRITNPIASAGAGLENICGNILDTLAPLRPQMVEVGCIW